MMSKAPKFTTLPGNGATVVDMRDDIVLCFWDKPNGRREWIVWRVDDDGNAHWGAYYDTLAEAVEGFAKR